MDKYCGTYKGCAWKAEKYKMNNGHSKWKLEWKEKLNQKIHKIVGPDYGYLKEKMKKQIDSKYGKDWFKSTANKMMGRQ